LIINKSDLDVLFDLGVSRSQACVYLALLKTGTLSLSEVSKSSGVSRPDSYRAISKLVDMGLVERIISNPTKFRPLSMNEGLSILLGQKEKENSELRLEAAHLSEEFKESRLVIETNDINHQFVSVAEGDGLLLKLNKVRSKKHLLNAYSKKAFILAPL
jgi:sugar-specific transcriptional regulator TrmB